MPSSATGLTVTIIANIKDFDALQAVVTEMVATAADKDPGTQAYSFSVDEERKTLFVYERYVNVAAFGAHAANMGPFADRYFGAVDVTSAAVHMPAGAALPPEIKQSLDAFGTKYMTFIGSLA